MSIKHLPLDQFRADPEATLNECFETGRPIVVEWPGRGLVAIQSLEPSAEPDDLSDRLIANNPEFRELLAKAAQGPRRPFPFGA